MTHENGKNIGGGAEFADADEQKIAGMLADLKRVEAPRDFDFHLKARIANARPEDTRRAGLFPILKYVMPLALFLFAGAGIVLYSSYNAGSTQDIVEVPGTAPASDSIPVPAATAASVGTASNGTSPGTLPGDSPIEVLTPARVPRSSGRTEGSQLATSRRPSGGGSVDFTRSSRSMPGSNWADKTGGNSDPAITPKDMSLTPKGVAEALRMIDAEAGFENSGWTIKSVKTKGIAEQMGLKAGDRLKSINGKPVEERSQFESSFNVRRITVQRGDATVELNAARPE